MFSIFILVKGTALKIIHQLGFPEQKLQGSLSKPGNGERPWKLSCVWKAKFGQKCSVPFGPTIAKQDQNTAQSGGNRVSQTSLLRISCVELLDHSEPLFKKRLTKTCCFLSVVIFWWVVFFVLVLFFGSSHVVRTENARLLLWCFLQCKNHGYFLLGYLVCPNSLTALMQFTSCWCFFLTFHNGKGEEELQNWFSQLWREDSVANASGEYS